MFGDQSRIIRRREQTTGPPAAVLLIIRMTIRLDKYARSIGWAGFSANSTSVAPVPEPATLALLEAAGLGLLARRRKTI
jgi:hypothetical protein